MEKIVSITNRNVGWTGYTIPDTGVTRNFSPRETKKVPLEELQQLQYVAGGDYILKHCFVIDDKDALSVLNMEDVEPEYFYTEEEVKEILTNGSLDQLEDCLNFAPAGVIELVKNIAIATELPDTRKRKMISEKTGFSIDNAIMVNTVMAAEDETAKVDEKPTRKAAPVSTKSAAPQRKATPQYKVVSTEK